MATLPTINLGHAPPKPDWYQLGIFEQYHHEQRPMQNQAIQKSRLISLS